MISKRAHSGPFPRQVPGQAFAENAKGLGGDALEERAGHALVVGGTGMLRQVAMELSRTHRVSVVARDAGRLAELRQEVKPGVICPIAQDYRNLPALRAAMRAAEREFGPIRLAVLWAPDEVAAAVAGELKTDARLLRVLGSRAIEPSADPDAARRRTLVGGVRPEYQEVILGFVVSHGGARWLTRDEISGGVLQAIADGSPRHIVGTVRPWELRP